MRIILIRTNVGQAGWRIHKSDAGSQAYNGSAAMGFNKQREMLILANVTFTSRRFFRIAFCLMRDTRLDLAAL